MATSSTSHINLYATRPRGAQTPDCQAPAEASYIGLLRYYTFESRLGQGANWGRDIGVVVAWVPGIFGGVYLFKRMLFATAAVQRERMPGRLIGTAALL